VILAEIQGCHNALSPENLTCDGELWGRALTSKAARLRSQLRALIAELGREPTDREIYAP
jgi:hypothetical protein